MGIIDMPLKYGGVWDLVNSNETQDEIAAKWNDKKLKNSIDIFARSSYPSSSTQASPPTQNEVEAQDNEVEDQANEPPQDVGNDQGGDANDQDKEDKEPRPPHPRFHQAIQRDHPVDTILGVGVVLRYAEGLTRRSSFGQSRF